MTSAGGANYERIEMSGMQAMSLKRKLQSKLIVAVKHLPTAWWSLLPNAGSERDRELHEQMWTDLLSLDEYEVNKVVDMFIGERWIEVRD